ncbi:MAG: bifunctional folylpolyglutamate synthase/dihydrofolate synthase, partial [Verrucomicrobia bacterium]|nr:bifunctional folylpolyglutamate synthase/dihydrofolate synthase [Verrucomicrobiota bacterium]
MNFQEALDWLNDSQFTGIKLGLENTFRLLEAIGNPQERLRFLHVAGTNGKGSVCAMLDSCLRAAGHKTGLYTSPHLVDFRER